MPECCHPGPFTSPYFIHNGYTRCFLCTSTGCVHAVSPISTHSRPLVQKYSQITTLHDNTPLYLCSSCHIFYDAPNPGWFFCPNNDVLRSILHGTPAPPSHTLVYIPYLVHPDFACNFPSRFYPNPSRCRLQGWEGEPVLTVLNALRALSTLKTSDIVDVVEEGRRGLMGFPRETAELLRGLTRMVVRTVLEVWGELGPRVDTDETACGSWGDTVWRRRLLGPPMTEEEEEVWGREMEEEMRIFEEKKAEERRVGEQNVNALG